MDETRASPHSYIMNNIQILDNVFIVALSFWSTAKRKLGVCLYFRVFCVKVKRGNSLELKGRAGFDNLS